MKYFKVLYFDRDNIIYSVALLASDASLYWVSTLLVDLIVIPDPKSTTTLAIYGVVLIAQSCVYSIA